MGGDHLVQKEHFTLDGICQQTTADLSNGRCSCRVLPTSALTHSPPVPTTSACTRATLHRGHRQPSAGMSGSVPRDLVRGCQRSRTLWPACARNLVPRVLFAAGRCLPAPEASAGPQQPCLSGSQQHRTATPGAHVRGGGTEVGDAARTGLVGPSSQQRLLPSPTVILMFCHLST